MRKCLGPHILITVLIVLTVSLAGCEKERPAPEPTATVALPLRTVVPTIASMGSQPAATQVTLPGQESEEGAGEVSPALPTPAPLIPPTSTPPPPAPLPSAAPTSVRPTTRSDEYFAYTVAAGDTLGDIAERFDVSAEEILALNPIVDPDLLAVGQELKVPGEASPSQGGTNSYVVRPGDTLFSIALRFGVSMAALQDINNIGDPDQIAEGQELRIPTSAGSSPPRQAETYAVQNGDTLFSIALQFGITLWDLQVANGISDPDQVFVGQVLTIP